MHEITVGDRISDPWGSTGIVQKITLWDGELTAENHGTIEVLLDSGDLEHYSFFGWRKDLTIIDEVKP